MKIKEQIIMKLLNFLSDKFSVQDNYKEQVRVKKYEFKKLDIEALTKDNVDGDLNAQHEAFCQVLF